MIKLQVIGYLGRDCEMKEVNNKTVINFNVAHSEKFKDSSGNLVDKTIWVKCAYWTDRSAVAQYLKKGKLVYVEGTPDTEAYTNKEGQPASSLKLRVFNLQLLSGSGDNQSDGGGSAGTMSQAVSPVAAEVEEPADDLPF